MRDWTAAEADAALPDVTARVERIRALLTEASDTASRTRGNGQRSRSGDGTSAGSTAGAELRAELERLDDDGILLRDAERGLVDFHAVAPSGREYWLCWLVGEPQVAWWHWPEDGFAGRTPLAEPPG